MKLYKKCILALDSLHKLYYNFTLEILNRISGNGVQNAYGFQNDTRR